MFLHPHRLLLVSSIVAGSACAILAGCGDDSSPTTQPAELASGDSQDLAGQPVAFDEIAHGDVSRYRYRDFSFFGTDLVLRDAASWAAFWSEHKPASDPPSIDFDRKMVLVTFLGSQGSRCDGPSVRFTAVRHQQEGQGGRGGAIIASVADGFDDGRCQRYSNPFHMVAVERLMDDVRFEHDPPREPRNLETVEYGELSSWRAGDPSFDREDLIIRTEEHFRAFWPRHSDRAVPPVDFTREMVIGLFLGPQPTSCGPYVLAERAVIADGQVTIIATDDRMHGDCMSTSSPYHLIRIDRTDLPIVFEHREVVEIP